jgi:hypothetical protein
LLHIKVKDFNRDFFNCTALSLDLSRKDLGPEEAAEQLKQWLRNVTTLSIAQKKQVTTLSLDLRDNDLGPEGGNAVAEAIAQLKHVTTLSLDLRDNGLGPEGGKAVAEAIAQLKHVTTLSLDLSRNYLGPDPDEGEVLEPVLLPAAELQEATAIPDGTWVVSKSKTGHSMTLHRLGNCWRRPGVHFSNFVTLEDDHTGGEPRPVGDFHRVCRDCFPVDEENDQGSSVSCSVSSDSSASEA